MSACSCTGPYPCVGCEADGWPVDPEHIAAYGHPMAPPPIRPYAVAAAPVVPVRTLRRRGNPPVIADGPAFAGMSLGGYTDRKSFRQGRRR